MIVIGLAIFLLVNGIFFYELTGRSWQGSQGNILLGMIGAVSGAALTYSIFYGMPERLSLTFFLVTIFEAVFALLLLATKNMKTQY